MESDVESVIEAARDISGAPKVTLIGLRIGANVAARVAARLDAEVESAVLWDPIVSGKSYLRSMSGGPSQGPVSTASSAMRRGLRDLEFHDVSQTLSGGSLVLVTESEEPLALPDITGVFRPGAWLNSEVVTAPCCWVESATTTGALPVAIIRRIETWLR
jgi:pimeloyl-ACP methyl ester carboxylesterase